MQTFIFTWKSPPPQPPIKIANPTYPQNENTCVTVKKPVSTKCKYLVLHWKIVSAKRRFSFLLEKSHPQNANIHFYMVIGPHPATPCNENGETFFKGVSRPTHPRKNIFLKKLNGTQKTLLPVVQVRCRSGQVRYRSGQVQTSSVQIGSYQELWFRLSHETDQN